MSDAVAVALIGLLGTMITIILNARLNAKVNRVGRDARAARVQVENNHSTNMREEGDERHVENSTKLDTILEEIKSLRGSVSRLWQRTDKQNDDIHELQLTQPRDRFAPPAKHRGDP